MTRLYLLALLSMLECNLLLSTGNLLRKSRDLGLALLLGDGAERTSIDSRERPLVSGKKKAGVKEMMLKAAKKNNCGTRVSILFLKQGRQYEIRTIAP